MSQLEFQVAVFSPKLVSELGFVFCAQVFLSPQHQAYAVIFGAALKPSWPQSACF